MFPLANAFSLTEKALLSGVRGLYDESLVLVSSSRLPFSLYRLLLLFSLSCSPSLHSHTGGERKWRNDS